MVQTNGNSISLRSLLHAVFGVKVKQIKTGSELVMVKDMAWYLKDLGGLTLEFDVPVHKELLHSKDMHFCIIEGLDLGVNTPHIEREKLDPIDRVYKFFFRNNLKGLVFMEDKPDRVVYNYEFDISNNSVLHRGDRAYGYANLVGFLAVRAFLAGRTFPELVIEHASYVHDELEYVHLLILEHYGNKFLMGRLTLNMMQMANSTPIWEAYVIEHKQRGHMMDQSSNKDKYDHLKKNFEIGDVVLLYRKSKRSKKNSMGTLESMFPAVIKGFDQDMIRLEFYPNYQTKLTTYYNIDMVREHLQHEGKRSIYTEDDYYKFPKREETFNLVNIGVCHLTFREDAFIIEPIESDGTYQYLKTKTGASHIFLNTLETIYAVFEDRGVSYNKQRYLDRYFKGVTPIYDQYMKALKE